ARAFHSLSSASASGIRTSRGAIVGRGKPCHSQKLGAVGQLARAMVVSPFSRAITNPCFRIGSSEMPHSEQPVLAFSNLQVSVPDTAGVAPMVRAISSRTFKSRLPPMVATESLPWLRLIEIALSKGLLVNREAAVFRTHGSNS